MIAHLFDTNIPVDVFYSRYKNVRDNSWRAYYKRFVAKMAAMVKPQNSSVVIKKERKMSGEDRNRRNFGIVSSLKAGKSLREIGERVGLDHKQVYRIGAARGVFSVRSNRSRSGKR